MNTKQAIETLDRCIRSRYPIIGVQSHEERRVLDGILEIAQKRNRIVYTWSLTRGLVMCKTAEHPESPLKFDTKRRLTDPVNALDEVYTQVENHKRDVHADHSLKFLFVFIDLHHIMQESALVVRYLRDIATLFESTPHNLILLSPEIPIPNDLEKTIYLMDWPLPDANELRGILEGVLEDLVDEVIIDLNADSKEAIVQAMRGLSAFEAESALLSAIVATGKVSADITSRIVAEKRQIINKAKALEFFDQTVTMNDVGGLRGYKEYSRRKLMTFTDKARKAHVDMARGVVIVGVQGTGKSLAAKATAGGKLPLLRLDAGALMGSLVGQSEQQTRQALRIAEAVAPSVLWIDEMEKIFGDTFGELDGGTSGRVLATVLTWMQERTAPVYIVATSNSVENVKPELLRRFDNIFFVDLPNFYDRMEIFRIHLEKREQNVSKIDLDALAARTWGFNGDEIEKVVREALETAFIEGRKMSTELLMESANKIVPIYETMREQIESIRKWAEQGRAVYASAPLEEKDAIPIPISSGEDGRGRGRRKKRQVEL